MSATIACAPNFMLRRLTAVVVLAALIAIALVAVVHANEPAVHVQFLRGGTQQVSHYDGGAPLQASGAGH